MVEWRAGGADLHPLLMFMLLEWLLPEKEGGGERCQGPSQVMSGAEGEERLTRPYH